MFHMKTRSASALVALAMLAGCESDGDDDQDPQQCASGQAYIEGACRLPCAAPPAEACPVPLTPLELQVHDGADPSALGSFVCVCQ